MLEKLYHFWNKLEATPFPWHLVVVFIMIMYLWSFFHEESLTKVIGFIADLLGAPDTNGNEHAKQRFDDYM